MTTIKLCLGILALIALQATILATPALAQAGKPHVVRLPPQTVKARPTLPQAGCYTRSLDQGSGSVRICG